MKEINPELVKNLYAKYSPETDVESKMAYIQEKYGDNQDEFVRNFYAKYDPNVDVDSKIEYINKAYTVKKNENSEPTSQMEGTDSPTEQVVEEPISVESSLEEKKNDENSYQDWFLGSSKGTVSSIEKEEEEPAPVSSLPEVYNLPEGGINTEEIQKTIDEGNLGFTPSEIDAQEKNKLRAERGLLQIDINDQKDLTLNPISEEEVKAEQDRINAISIKNQFPESANDPVVLRNSDDPFDRGMGRIDDFFWQAEQKSVADLNKAFDQYGFKFEEAVGGIDAIKVTSANSEEIIVRKVGNKDVKVTELKDFLNKNRVESTIVHDRIKGVLGKDVKKETRVLTEDELDEESNIYTLQFEAYQEKVKDYKKRVQILKDFTPQTQQELNIYNTEIKNVNTLGESINKGREELISSEDNLNKLTSDYLYYEAEKWDVASLVIQSIASGVTKTLAGGATLLSEAAEVITYINNPALSKKIGDVDGFKIVEDKIIAGRDQIIDDLQVLGSTNVAIENIKEDNFVAGSLLSVLESAPAMVAGLPGLFAMSYGAADDAFREYEGYEDIGKIEAFTMKVGLSAAAAYLEKAGLDNAMGRTGLLNRFLLQTLKEVPKDATELVIRRTLERRAIDFVKGLGSAAVGEGITEGAQEAVDITAKAVYNAMKGIDVFKTPETFVEGVMQVGESTAAGVIGGIALGGAGAVATAVSTEQVSKLPDGIVEMFEMMSASSKFDPLFSQSLKVQLAKGTITKEQAQNQLDNYHEAKAIIKTIPKDYTTPQKKMAMSLLVTKKNLEKNIAGQDPFIATNLKQQLDKVNASLSTIKQDITNMNEGTEVSNTDKKYFFNFKSKNEIPASLKKVKPVGKAVSKKTKLSKAENIQLAFTGRQLIESGFAVEQKAKTTTEVQPATKTTTEVQPATKTTTEAQEEVVVETTPAIEAEETVGQVVNRPVMLTEYGGKVFDEPIKGNLLIEDQRVSFEAEDGKIYDIGNKNDLENKRIDEVGIKYEAPNVKVSKDGSLEVGGNKYTIQTNLPTVGVEYNDDGDVTAVSVKDDSGKPVMFKGTIAEEMGYQILLNEAESDAQKNKINEILEKDEEFKNELRQAEESSKKEADTNTEEAVRKTVDNQETEVESEPKTTTQVEAKKVQSKPLTKGVSKLRSKFKPKQETEEKTKAAPRKDIDDQVENAKKALSKVAPEVEIIVSESEAEYKKATKEGRNQNSGGTYVDGKIYINPNRANKRTVAHEVFHALLLSKGRTDQQAQAITERMMEAVKKNADQELLDRLEEFSSKYENALQSEESIAELMGILAEGYPKLNTEAKSLIKRWLDRLAKIFGIKPLTSDTDIINFLNTVSGKIASGKKIKSRDIKVLGDVQGKAESQSRQQKSDRPSIAEVLEYAKKENISEKETIEFLKEEGYSDAEINEAIEIDKEIERQSKKSTKRPLSAKKISKKEPAPKKGFTTTQLIKLQESVSKLAERVTKKNIKEKRKAIKEIIASFEKGKSISTAKSQAITNRVNNVNLGNRKAVESLIEYIEKTYSDSKSKEDTINLDNKRRKAKENIRSKIGEAKGSFEYFLSLFSYDPKLITDKNLLAEYQYLVEQYADSSKVFVVKDIRNDAETAKKIIESIEEEFDQFNSLFDLFNENTILTDGELDIEETIKALKDSEQIDSKQAAILTKYKDKLDATSKELKKFNRETAIKEALDYNGEVSNNVTESAMSRGFASKFLKLAATESNLKSLSNNQLRNLKKVLENINNGIFSHSATEILNEMDVKQNTDALQELVNKAKALKIESLLGEIRSSLTLGRNTSEYSQVSSNALKDIDNILGLKGTELYDRTFKRAAVMTSNYEEAVRAINDELVRLNTEIDKGSKSFNDAVKSKYKIQAYKLQLEYDSNKKLQNSTVFPAEQWIDETIKALEDKKQSNDVELLKQVKKEISGKDAKTIYEGFSEIESEAVKTLKNINDGLTEKALFTGAVIRGNRPTIVNDYLFHDVMSTDNKTKEAKDVANDGLNKVTNISTQAGTGKERTPGLKALNMDPLNSTLRGAKQTLLDFHITNENRVIKKTLNSLEKSTNPGAARDFIIASNKAYDTGLRVQFANAYAPRNILDKLTNVGYQAQLASVPRAFAELTSNLLYVGFSDPISFGKGVKILKEIGVSEALEYMRLSGSSELGKFTGAKGTGKTMESINLNEDVSRAKASSYVMNAIKTIYAKAGYKGANLKNLGKVAGLASDFLISKPDKLVSLPLWTGQFVSALKASKVDLARFKSEPEYRSEMSNEIEAARNKADKSLTMAAGSKNAFSGVLKNKVDKINDSAQLQAYKYVNAYLTNFLIYEFSNARKGILGLVHKGDLTPAQGAAMLAATTARMASYTAFYKMFQGIFYGALNLITGGEEEEKEKEEDIIESLTRGIIPSSINLLVGRNFGQVGRIFLNMGSEYVNEEYLGFLRDGEEYNAFEHGLGVSFFNPTERDMRGDSFYKKSALQLAGPLNPLVKVLEDMRVNYAKYNYATSQQEKDKASDYFVKQMLFDVVGSVTGKIPLYKDLKKTLFQIPKNNEFLQKKNQFTYKEMKEQDEDNFNNTEEKLKEDKKYKELVNTSKDLKGVIDSGVLSSEATKEASFKLKTINKDKEDYKRDYFENSLGLKGKKRDKTNSKNDGLTLDQGITKQKEAAKYDNDITYIKENLSKDDFEDIEYDFKSSDRISDIDYDLGDLRNQLKYTPKDSEEKKYNSIKNKIEKKSKKRKELKRIFYNNKYNAIKKKSGID